MDDFENNKNKYNLNKKLKRDDNDKKRIKSPINKGSVRTQSKESLRRYIDTYDNEDPEDFDDFEDLSGGY